MTDLRRFLAVALASTCLVPAALATPFAYVNDVRTIHVVDIQTRAVVAQIPMTTSSCAREIGALPGHRYVYAIDSENEGGRYRDLIAVIDSISQARVATIRLDARAYSLTLNPTKPRLYALQPDYPAFEGLEPAHTRLSMINTDSNAEVGHLDFAGGVSSVVFNSSGTRAYLNQPYRNKILVLDTATEQVITVIATGPQPVAMAMHPVANLLYVGQSNYALQSYVAVVDLLTGLTIDTIPVGAYPFNMAINPAGTRLFVLNWVNETLSVIDTVSRRVIATLPAPGGASLDVSPDGDRVFVTQDGAVSSSGRSALNVISIDTLKVVEKVPLLGVCSSTTEFIGGAVPTPPEVPGVLSGLWGNPAEPGWGVHLAQRRDTVFAAWHTYDTAGAAHWYVASSCAMAKPLACPTCVDNTICSGLLYEVSGPRFFTDPFDPAGAHAREAGLIEIQFRDRDNAFFTHVVDRHGKSVQIRRHAFAAPVAAAATNYTDLWFSPRETGWGLGITHQAGAMFLAWFVYDDVGRPSWLFASDCRVSAAGDSCSGDVYRSSGPIGPAAGVPYDASRLHVVPVGNVTVSFSNASAGMMTWKVDGREGARHIVRQLF